MSRSTAGELVTCVDILEHQNPDHYAASAHSASGAGIEPVTAGAGTPRVKEEVAVAFALVGCPTTPAPAH